MGLVEYFVDHGRDQFHLLAWLVLDKVPWLLAENCDRQSFVS